MSSSSSLHMLMKLELIWLCWRPVVVVFLAIGLEMKNSKCQNRMDGKHGGRKRRRQGSNELLLKNLYLSCDPYMRIMMTKDTTSGIGALIPGSVCHAISFINYYYHFLLVCRGNDKYHWKSHTVRFRVRTQMEVSNLVSWARTYGWLLLFMKILFWNLKEFLHF
jgi:hypothetical protein